jgi:hypothetical protein
MKRMIIPTPVAVGLAAGVRGMAAAAVAAVAAVVVIGGAEADGDLF